MITTKTFTEDDTQDSLRKIDVIAENSDCIVGLRVTDLNGLVEVSIDPDTKEPYFTRRRLHDLCEVDRKEILRVGYKTFKKPWTEEDDFELIALYMKFNGNEREIARVMQRSERGIHMRLKALNVQFGHQQPKSRNHFQTRLHDQIDHTRSLKHRSTSRRRRKASKTTR